MKTERIVRTYSDAAAIGTIEMTDDQFSRYIKSADSDTGAIKLNDLVLLGDYVASETCGNNPTVYVE